MIIIVCPLKYNMNNMRALLGKKRVSKKNITILTRY